METLENQRAAALDESAGKFRWIYAKKPGGKWFNRRQWVGYGLLLFLFTAPFIRIDGHPLLMFNIVERKFSIFGALFYPQDLHIFVFGMLVILVSIVLFTALFGRVWCGWTCPQTIFMELIFRRIEYWIEGDWMQQRKLNEGPDTDTRAWKKLLKHSIFLLIAFVISNLFLSYIIGTDELLKIIREPIGGHTVGFVAIVLFTLVFYGVFAFVREKVCTTICPYGRLQSVLLDESTRTVAYDSRRGEPRGKRRQTSDPNLGDCIDCKLCVQVCPTGIDIRNGIQMECVSCTACIDACDAVMKKIGRPKELIGFYSAKEVQGEVRQKKVQPRTITYSMLLLVLLSALGWMLASRSEIDGRLLRATGSTYQMRDDGTVSNLYTLELLNKSTKDIPFELQTSDERLRIQMVNKIDRLPKEGKAVLSFFVVAKQGQMEQYKSNIVLKLVDDGNVLETLKTTFISPPGKP